MFYLNYTQKRNSGTVWGRLAASSNIFGLGLLERETTSSVGIQGQSSYNMGRPDSSIVGAPVFWLYYNNPDVGSTPEQPSKCHLKQKNKGCEKNIYFYILTHPQQPLLGNRQKTSKRPKKYFGFALVNVPKRFRKS